MKKRILLVLLVILGITLVGCATTKTTDVFRFEVRELKLTLLTNEENKEKELKLIRGDTDKNATIVYTVSYTAGDKAGTVDMNNGIIEVRGSGTDENGYVTTKGINDTVKIVPLAEGVVRFTAFVQGKENISDTIVITVGKEGMNAYSISAVFSNIYVGKTTSFRTSAIPSHIDASVLRYEVSDEKIATISDAGVLKGLAVGEVTVKAYSKYDPSMYAITKVKVSYADSGSIILYDEEEYEFDEDEILLTKGDSFIFSTEVKGKDMSLAKESVNQKVTYEVKDSSIARVKTSEDGVTSLEALRGGQTEFTIKSADGKAKLTIDVNVKWAQTESLDLEKEEFDIFVKKSDTVKRTEVNPSNANPDFELGYKDEADKEIVKIDGTKIEGLKPGVAYVIVKTIESEGNTPIEKEVKVTVTYDTIEEIKLQSNEMSIMTEAAQFTDGQCQVDLKWSLVPAGSNPAVTITSNNVEVATVDENGKVTIFDKVGTATITIVSNDNAEVKAEFVVNVTNKPTSFDVEGPDDETVFVYSDDLVVQFTVSILPADVSQDLYDVYIDNQGDCYVDYTTDGNVITLIFDPDGLGQFDVEITVNGVKTIDGANSWIRSYEVVEGED